LDEGEWPASIDANRMAAFYATVGLRLMGARAWGLDRKLSLKPSRYLRAERTEASQ